MVKIRNSIFAIAAISFLAISCQSTSKAAPVAQDSYGTESSSNATTTATTAKNTNTASSNGSSFFKYGNKGDYITIAPTTCFSKSVLGSLGQKDGEVVFYVKDFSAGLASSYQGLYYISLFNEGARAKLAKAYDQYLSDFENKKLDRKGSKTYKAYGNAKVTLRWGTLSTSTPNFGTGDMSFGYEFDGNSPYFTITMYPIYNDYYDIVGESVKRESILYKIYFTKAQAKQLVDNLSKDVIDQYKRELQGFDEARPSTEKDEY